MSKTRTHHGNAPDQAPEMLVGDRTASYSPTGPDFLDIIHLPPTFEAAGRYVRSNGTPWHAPAMEFETFRVLQDELAAAWEQFKKHGPVRHVLARVNAKMEGVSPVLERVENEVVIFNSGPTLGILWLQMANAIASKTVFRSCLECARAFAPARRGAGQGQPYCSGNCRSRAAQRRKIAADDPRFSDDGSLHQAIVERWHGGADFPLAYSGVGPGVPIKDWPAAILDLVKRHVGKPDIQSHLNFNRWQIEFPVHTAANEAEFDLPEHTREL